MEESNKQAKQANNDDQYDLDDDEEEDRTGTGRSYECVFCKRGFTTAQALGGHMNIHRKDRAKTKPQPTSSSTCSTFFKDYQNPNFFSSSSMIPNNQHNQHDSSINYYSRADFESNEMDCHMYFPAPTSHMQPLIDPSYRNHEDWCASLSLHIGPTAAAAAHLEDSIGRKRMQGCSKEDKLDLELRLGHHP